MTSEIRHQLHQRFVVALDEYRRNSKLTLQFLEWMMSRDEFRKVYGKAIEQSYIYTKAHWKETP